MILAALTIASIAIPTVSLVVMIVRSLRANRRAWEQSERAWTETIVAMRRRDAERDGRGWQGW